MKERPRRLKRILLAMVCLEILASPALLMMEDGPPKFIAGGIWFAVLLLTALAILVIGIATQIDKR